MKTITTICLLISTTLPSYNLLAADYSSAPVTTSSAASAPAPTMPSGGTSTQTTQTTAVNPPPISIPVPPPTESANPTADFFIALSQCTGGMYRELNLLNDSVGNQWLNQQIIGLDDQGFCQVLLATPDNRTLHCYFDPYDVAPLADQHFLTGMIMAETNRQSKEALAAENKWSTIKNQNCGFDGTRP